METTQAQDRTQFNVGNQIANAMAERAFVFNHLERILRKAAAENRDVTVSEIMDDEAIKGADIKWWRIRDALYTLENHNYVIVSNAGRLKLHRWNVHVGPFVLGTVLQRKAATKPSRVKTIKPEKEADSVEAADVKYPKVAPELLPKDEAVEKEAEAPAATDELELVFGGATIVVGRNPATGRLRVVIGE